MRALTTGNAFRPSTTALMKNDDRPSLTPCFFSNDSLYLARSSLTAVMSASLNVVNEAVVCCDSISRWAIRARIVLIFCRVSRGPAPVGAGAGGVDLGRRLVGFQLRDRLVEFGVLAVLLEPAGQDHLGHRLAGRRHLDLNRHRRGSQSCTTEGRRTLGPPSLTGG